MRNYWWLGVTRDVGWYVEECNMCQKMKNRTEVPVEKLKLSEVPEKPWTYLMVGFITKLPLVFRDNVWKLYGLLESVVSDRGPQFAAELIKEFNRMLGIEMKLLIVFHSQTYGQTERINQELEQYLRFFIYHRQKN